MAGPQTLADFRPLLPAEQALLARMATEEPVEIGPTLPDIGDATRKIRAELIAFLARSDDAEAAPPPRGLDIRGAWISGPLDLRGPEIELDLGFFDCRFDAAPNLRSARLANLFLNGSHLPGIGADRLEARGGVFLRGAVVQGEARFLGARLGGDLSCKGARLENRDGKALSADRLEARGGVFLSGALVKGEARFLFVRLYGNLSCDDARFENANGTALNLAGARVDGAFFLRKNARILGRLDLTEANFGTISDVRDCWPAPGELILHRCRYGAFTGGPTDARSRLDWLALQSPARYGEDFWPQPYEQLAKVLREMGHKADARSVLVTKERLQRRAARDALRASLRGGAMRLRLEQAKPEARERTIAAANALLSDPTLQGPDHNRAWAQISKSRLVRLDRAAPERQPMEGDDDLAQRLRAARRDLAQPAADPRSAARKPAADLWGALLLRSVWDQVLGAVLGYGHRPQQVFLWLLGLWLMGAVIFGVAAGRDALSPNQILAFRGPEWVRCNPVDGGGQDLRPGETRRACFHRQPEAAAYQSFNALIYSLDAMLPLVDLGMEGYWIPDESAPRGAPWHERIGWWTRAYLWVHIALGWALSLLAVAGFSGLVKSDRQ